MSIVSKVFGPKRATNAEMTWVIETALSKDNPTARFFTANAKAVRHIVNRRSRTVGAQRRSIEALASKANDGRAMSKGELKKFRSALRKVMDKLGEHTELRAQQKARRALGETLGLFVPVQGQAPKVVRKNELIAQKAEHLDALLRAGDDAERRELIRIVRNDELDDNDPHYAFRIFQEVGDDTAAGKIAWTQATAASGINDVTAFMVWASRVQEVKDGDFPAALYLNGATRLRSPSVARVALDKASQKDFTKNERLTLNLVADDEAAVVGHFDSLVADIKTERPDDQFDRLMEFARLVSAHGGFLKRRLCDTVVNALERAARIPHSRNPLAPARLASELDLRYEMPGILRSGVKSSSPDVMLEAAWMLADRTDTFNLLRAILTQAAASPGASTTDARAGLFDAAAAAKENQDFDTFTQERVLRLAERTGAYAPLVSLMWKAPATRMKLYIAAAREAFRSHGPSAELEAWMERVKSSDQLPFEQAELFSELATAYANDGNLEAAQANVELAFDKVGGIRFLDQTAESLSAAANVAERAAQLKGADPEFRAKWAGRAMDLRTKALLRNPHGPDEFHALEKTLTRLTQLKPGKLRRLPPALKKIKAEAASRLEDLS